MKETSERIKNLLIEHQIRPSNYRIRVLQCLEDKKLHPTADEIYQNLTKEYPTLSKMSVYNTIDILQKSGLIRSITIENNEVRYDALLEEHGHFKCTVCGKISNFGLDMKQLMITGLDRFQIEEKDVFFKGVCPDCLKNRNSK
jgi:Fur family transcriptional regulator, peroxide stress response regulator